MRVSTLLPCLQSHRWLADNASAEYQQLHAAAGPHFLIHTDIYPVVAAMMCGLKVLPWSEVIQRGMRYDSERNVTVRDREHLTGERLRSLEHECGRKASHNVPSSLAAPVLSYKGCSAVGNILSLHLHDGGSYARTEQKRSHLGVNGRRGRSSSPKASPAVTRLRSVVPPSARSTSRSLPSSTSKVLDNSNDYEHYGLRGDLWSSFGCDGDRNGCTGHKYVARNALMASLIGTAAPRRVFEFAGNGGFLMQTALLTPSVHTRLVEWVHSDFAFGAVEYAAVIISDNRLLGDMSVNADPVVAARRATGWRAMLPFSRVLTRDAAPLPLSDKLNITVLQVDIRNPPFQLSTFDTVVTISFEHILEDLGVIRKLKVGTAFVFGVATFAHHEHHRHFTSATEVRQRYCEMLNISGVYLAAPLKVVVASVRSASASCGDGHFYSHEERWDPWPASSAHSDLGRVRNRGLAEAGAAWHPTGHARNVWRARFAARLTLASETVRIGIVDVGYGGLNTMSSLLVRYLETPDVASRVQLLYFNIRGKSGWDAEGWQQALQDIEKVDALFIACGTASAISAINPAIVAGFKQPPSIIISLSDYAVEVLGNFLRGNDRSLALVFATDKSADVGYIRDKLLSGEGGAAAVSNNSRIILQGCRGLAGATEIYGGGSKEVEAVAAKCITNGFAKVISLWGANFQDKFTHIGVGLACSHYGYARPYFESHIKASLQASRQASRSAKISLSIFDIAKLLGRDSSIIDFAVRTSAEQRAIKPSVELKLTSRSEPLHPQLAWNMRKFVISPVLIAFLANGTMIRVPIPRNSVNAHWATRMRSRPMLQQRTETVNTIAKANLARNIFALSGVQWLDEQAVWSYSMMPCMQGKFKKLADLLQGYACDGVLEIGGGLNPMDHFKEFKLGYIDIEPMAALQLYEGLDQSTHMHLPTTLGHYWSSNASFSQHERKLLKPNGYCMVLAGGFVSVGLTDWSDREAEALEHYALGAKVLVLEGGGTRSGFTKLADTIEKRLAPHGMRPRERVEFSCNADPQWKLAEKALQFQQAWAERHIIVYGNRRSSG